MNVIYGSLEKYQKRYHVKPYGIIFEIFMVVFEMSLASSIHHHIHALVLPVRDGHSRGALIPVHAILPMG